LWARGPAACWLWQLLDLAFAATGDMYIGEGHANESSNDAGSDDPADNMGALDLGGMTYVPMAMNSIREFDSSAVLSVKDFNGKGSIWILIFRHGTDLNGESEAKND
jgi:hypothetical protein